MVSATPTPQPAVEWVRPTGKPGQKALWGVKGGLLVGLWPSDGPRGLIRIYTPYLDQREGRIMNFIAIEPIVRGERSLSEIEESPVDHAMGKRFWSADHVDLSQPPAFTDVPAAGVLTSKDGVETLSFYVLLDPFKTGARPIVKVTLSSDRPREVALSPFAAADSAPMEACVLTATMGNFARLRHLHLKDRTIDAPTLFATAKQGFWDFYPWFEWNADQMNRAGNELTVSATGDPDTGSIEAVPPGWRYEGRQAVQTWSTPARGTIHVRVNGRSTFWSTRAAIPGGPSFENFELFSPFEAGQTFRFGIEESK